MQNYYSDLEGLRLGMEIETRGKEFYRYAYEHAKEKSTKRSLPVSDARRRAAS